MKKIFDYVSNSDLKFTKFNRKNEVKWHKNLSFLRNFSNHHSSITLSSTELRFLIFEPDLSFKVLKSTKLQHIHTQEICGYTKYNFFSWSNRDTSFGIDTARHTQQRTNISSLNHKDHNYWTYIARIRTSSVYYLNLIMTV